MIYFVAKLFEQLLLYSFFFPNDTSNVLIIYLPAELDQQHSEIGHFYVF